MKKQHHEERSGEFHESDVPVLIAQIIQEHRFTPEDIFLRQELCGIWGNGSETFEVYEVSPLLLVMLNDQLRYTSFAGCSMTFRYNKDGHSWKAIIKANSMEESFLVVLLADIRDRLDATKRIWVEKGKGIIKASITHLLTTGDDEARPKINVFYKKGAFTAKFHIDGVTVTAEEKNPYEFKYILTNTINKVCEMGIVLKKKKRRRK